MSLVLVDKILVYSYLSLNSNKYAVNDKLYGIIGDTLVGDKVKKGQIYIKLILLKLLNILTNDLGLRNSFEEFCNFLLLSS